MTSRPTFTIVVPVFNRAEESAVAVRSALDQDDGVQAEVIVVDDGSTDETLSVLRTVRDPRVRVLSRPHEGRCAARNAGARHASGEWLVFLDSDDLLLPGALATFESLRTEGTRLIVAPTQQVSASGTASVRDVFRKHGAPLPWGLQAGGFAIHRSLFDELGGYCTGLDHSEHTEMAMRLRRVAPPPGVSCGTDPTVEVRMRTGRYDAGVQYRSAVHLLGHVGEELAADPEALARQLGVAGEAARRLGLRSEAIRYLARSFRAQPGWRAAARLIRSLAPMPAGRA